MFYKICYNDSIHIVDNNIYESKFLDNVDEDSQEEIIPIVIEIKNDLKKLFEIDIKNILKFSKELLKEYIEFWNYMMSHKFISKGIFCYVKNKYDFPINDDIDNFIEPIKSNSFEFIGYPIYNEYSKILLDNCIENKYIKEFASKGNLEMLKYTYNKFIEAKEQILKLTNLLINYCNQPYITENIWTHHILNDAIMSGNMDCVRFLVETNCPINSDVYAMASKCGNLECLIYLHTIYGCLWNEKTTYNASINNHLDCLKYAHENGCPWDEWTIIASIKSDSLECLEYMHKNGCPYDISMVNIFVKKNTNNRCLEYIDKNML